MSNSKSINVALMFACMLASFLVGYMVAGKVGKMYISYPAHMPVNNTSLTLVHKDVETDVAVYAYRNGFPRVVKGDVVTLSDGRTTTVTDVTVNGFYLNTADIRIQAGDSGEPIWYNNCIVGYVSTLYTTDLLYCIWDI